jgi:hypothetical protein
LSRLLCWGALAGCLLSACDDGTLRAFEPQALGISGGSSVGGSRATPSAGSAAGGAPVKPTSPLLIDDFEDGDTIAQKPLGWWYPVNDGTGTQGFGIEPVSRGTASVYALRTHGSGFDDWGAAVGVDLTGESPSLNALGYRQVCFVARVEAGSSSLLQVHFLQGGLHYIQELSFSEAWTRYCRPISEFVTPAQKALAPSELLALQVFFPPGSPFEFWLDDVELVP